MNGTDNEENEELEEEDPVVRKEYEEALEDLDLLTGHRPERAPRPDNDGEEGEQ